MGKRINNYSEYVICEILNVEMMYGNLLYEKTISYINVQRITIYKILERLAAKNIIEVVDNSEKKKYYRLTKFGQACLDDARQIYPRINLKKYTVVGENIIKLDTIDSTNSFVRMNRDGLNDGDVVIANHQLNVGERNGKSISSCIDTLEFSFLIKPNYEFEKSFYITQVLVSTMIKTLKDFGIKANVQWPHDIYVGEKLIGIIDVESSVKKMEIGQVIVGVALNINNESFEDSSVENTSIYLETGKKIDFNDILKVYFDYFNFFHQDLIVSKFVNFIKIFRENSNFIGQTLTKRNRGEFKVLDITERGNLIVARDNDLDLVIFGDVFITEA